jgi:hypothetical protein
MRAASAAREGAPVTDAEWLVCMDSHVMLDYLAVRFPKLKRPRKPKRSRAFRLFNVACCYRVWPWLQRAESRRAVIVGEQYADGLVTDAERQEAFHAALILPPGGMQPVSVAWEGRAVQPDAWLEVEAAGAASIAAGGDGMDDWYHYGGSARIVARAWPDGAAERGAQAGWLRDIFGNPFRTAPAVKPAWLEWRDGVARKLAESIYDGREFNRLPLLADALEDAGCADVELLGHLRGPGVHVRGCWAVDSILLKG